MCNYPAQAYPQNLRHAENQPLYIATTPCETWPAGRKKVPSGPVEMTDPNFVAALLSHRSHLFQSLGPCLQEIATPRKEIRLYHNVQYRQSSHFPDWISICPEIHPMIDWQEVKHSCHRHPLRSYNIGVIFQKVSLEPLTERALLFKNKNEYFFPVISKHPRWPKSAAYFIG